jgi:hypothetical protein
MSLCVTEWWERGYVFTFCHVRLLVVSLHQLSPPPHRANSLNWTGIVRNMFNKLADCTSNIMQYLNLATLKSKSI